MLGGKTTDAAVGLHFAPRHVVILIPGPFGHVIPAPIVFITIAAGGGRPFAISRGEKTLGEYKLYQFFLFFRKKYL